MNIEINDLILKILELNNTKSLKLHAAKDLFYNCLKIKNTNPDTIDYYKNLYYRLDKFFAKHSVNETKEIDDNLLCTLINECLEENLSANYINKLVKAVKYLIKLLAEFGYISEKTFKVNTLKEEEHRIDSIEVDKLKMILSYVKTQSLKTQAIVFLLLATGARRKEICNIKLECIDFEKNSIVLETTKTKKIRPCFFTDEVKYLLISYIKAYNPKVYLFEGDVPGVALPPRNVSKLLERIKVHLNLDSLSAHQFRHTFGTHIYNASLDIELTREFLGHTTYNMTKRYIHNSKSKLKQKYDMYNPLNNKSC